MPDITERKFRISQQLNNFLEILESIEDTLPSIKKNLFMEFKNNKEKFDRFIENNATNLTKDEDGYIANFVIPFEKHREALKLRRELSKSLKISIVVPINFLVSIISEYDAYLGELIKEIYINKPELLNSLEKNLTFNEIINFQSIDKIKEFVIEKDIESTLRKSHLEQLLTLEKKFSTSLTKGLDILPEFIEITERRNLFVHCKGIISSQYLKVCSDNNVSLDQVEIGRRLYASNKYLLRAINVISELVIKLTHVLWSKVFKEDQKEIDDNVIQLSFDLLCREKYQLAIDILILFTSKNAKHDSEVSKRFLIINLAIAYKFIGQKKKCTTLLDEYDWSAVSNLLKMAERILQEDYENASQHLKKAYMADEIKKQFILEWPLFKEFRDTDEFKKAYSELFPENNQDYISLPSSSENSNEDDRDDLTSQSEAVAEVIAQAEAETETETETETEAEAEAETRSETQIQPEGNKK